MGRKKSSNPLNTSITLRVDAATTAAIDAIKNDLDQQGISSSRGDAVRVLIKEALRAREHRERRRTASRSTP